MHTLTLLYVTNILTVLMSVVMLAAWRFNRQVPGLREWMAACFCSVLVTGIIVMHRGVPGGILVLVIQFFMLFTGWLVWKGARQYVDSSGILWWPAPLAMVLTMGLSVALAGLELAPGMRMLLSSAVTGTFYLLAARSIRAGEPDRYPARYLFGLTCAVHGVFVWLRPILVWLGDGTTGSLVIDAMQFNILESTIFVILLALGAVMLAAEFISNELRLLSQRDELTEIFNRRSFLSMLDKGMSACQRTGAPLAVLAIDLDHFKQINDRWGHLAGDKVLRSFTTTASACLRLEDVIGRLGGEEFAVLVQQANGDEALEVARRLRAAAEADAVDCGDLTVNYTVSIGVSQYQPGDTAESLLHRADQAMYRAKQAGRNRVES